MQKFCPVCCQRIRLVGGRFIRHHLPESEECWGSGKKPVSPRRVALCGCVCSRGVACGGCGHDGCAWRTEAAVGS